MEEEIDDNALSDQLVTLLIKGDQSAFACIYHSYAAELYRYAKQRISSKEDCEEMIQDVFESLWRRREELDSDIYLEGYLYKMVKFKVIRYFQHEKVVRKYLEHYTFFESVYDQLPEEVRLSDGPGIQALIEKGINTLPPRCGEAFRMRWSEDLSNGEIAERMKLSKETVENYIGTAVKQLREIFRKSHLAG